MAYKQGDGRGRPTRVDAILADLERAVASGAYRRGERLPSVRRAAQERGVSKNTMAEAYDRLVAHGAAEARPGSGYYVAQTPPPAPANVRPHVAEAVDQISLLREQLDPHHDIRPGDGRLPPSWMEASELRRHFQAFRAPGLLRVEFGYGSARGFAPLRERIRAMLLERSILADPDGVLLTHGVNHAFDLIIRLALEPGDTVFVDAPGYYPLFAKLALAKVHVVGVRRGPDGPDLEELQARLAQHRPKLFFTQPHAHNPTGGGLSLAGAHALLRLADRHGFTVVEDDTFADLSPASAPRLAALDGFERVIHVGGFSKTLSASLRCGYVAARPAAAAALCDLKMVTTVATSDYVERFVFGLIEGGHYLRHLRRLRARLAAVRPAALDDLASAGVTVRNPESTGFYLWAQLPEGTDEARLCREASGQGVFLAPGSVFWPDRLAPGPAATRINLAYASEPRLLAFLAAALQR